MAENSYLESIQQAQKFVEDHHKQWVAIDKSILSISQNIQKLGKSDTDGSLKELNKRIQEQVNARENLNNKVKESEKLARAEIAAANKKARQDTQQVENQKILARNARNYAKITSSLTTAYEKQAAILIKLRREYKDLEARKLRGQKLTKDEVAQMRYLRSEITRLDTGLKKIDASAGQFQRSVGNYGKALSSLGGVIRSVTSAFGIMGGAFLAVSILRDGTRRIKEFDKEMQNMAGITRGTREELESVEQTIINVSAESIKTSNEVAKLATSLIVLGKTKSEVEQLLLPVVNLGIGLDATSEAAGEFLVQTLNSFGAGTDSAEEFADIIATIRTSTSLNFQRMRDSFQYMSPIANALGHDLAWVGAVVGELSDNGLKAEQAGRVLSTAMQRLAKNGMSLAEALEEIEKLQENGASRQEAMARASELFGVQAAKTAVVLAGNTDVVEENAQAIRDNGGALDDLVDQQLESLDAKLRILDASYEKFILSVESGDGVLSKAFKGAVEGATNLLNAMSRLNETADDRAGKHYNELLKEELDYYKQIGEERARQVGEQASSMATSQINSINAELKALESKNEALKEDSKWYLKNAASVYQNQRKIDALTVSLSRAEARRDAAARQVIDHTAWLDRNSEAAEEAESKGRTYADVLADIAAQQKLLKDSTEEEAGAILDTIAALEKEAEAWKRSNKQRKEQKEIIDGSLDALSKQKALLEDERDRLATTSQAREVYNGKIEKVEAAIWRLVEAQKALKEQEKLFEGTGDFEGTAMGLFGDENDINAWQQHLRDSAEDEISIEDKKWEMLKAIREGGLDHYKYLNEQEIKIAEEAAKTQERIEKDLQRSVQDAVAAGVNSIYETRIEKLDRAVEANRDHYAQLLDNQELTEERRLALEAERDNKERKMLKERRELEREQFLVNQAVALAEVGIQVARGIAEATALAPATFGASLSWIPLIVGTGAAQAATIVAQSIPQFATGTENAPEGPAIVDEKTAEVHTDKKGRVKSFGSEKGPNLRFLEQGDKIYRSRDEYFKKQGLEGIEDTVWNLNMQYQGRPVSEKDPNLALAGKVDQLISSNEKLGRAMRKIAGRPINNNLKIEMPDNRPY